MGRQTRHRIPATGEAPLRQTELETLRQDQRALTGALSQREEFYRAVLDSLAEGVIITNADSRIIYSNAGVTTLSGYAREELAGRISYEVLSPRANWPKMRHRLRERLSGRIELYEHELVCQDGSIRWIAVRASPYRNAQGEIVGTVGALSCINRQKTLEEHNTYLQDEIRAAGQFGDIVGSSPSLTKVLEQIKLVAPTEASVLILGESGSGKELVARAIHEHGARHDKPLVRVNCASVPKELFESEFFGHVRGAFTGAIKDRIGRFELAHGGTLLLDEVGEIPLDLQSKLLRVLQEGQFEKVGEDRTRTVNVRIIAATNCELLGEVKAGRFRLDLYYRLSVFPIEVPPLRERPEDIMPLAIHFMKRSARRLGLALPHLGEEGRRSLENYDWPGNVRELQNVIERAAILARGGELRFHLGGPIPSPAGAGPIAPLVSGAAAPTRLADLKQSERAMIEAALRQTRGKVYGPAGAAARLGAKPTTLLSKIQRLGIPRWPVAA